MDFAAAMVLAGMISFVPPTIVLYLALSPALSKQERRYTAWSFAIILILETILYLYFFYKLSFFFFQSSNSLYVTIIFI